MAKVERKHEILAEPLTPELLSSKASEGWRPVAVVWERTAEGEPGEDATQAVPYGLRVAADCAHLETEQSEVQAMVVMLKLIVDETPFAQIAAELNQRGIHTRRGTAWNQTSVFHMLPRLIEVAPSIYSSSEWAAMKPHLQRAARA